MSIKKLKAKYRKVHVPMKHASIKKLDVMGVHQCGRQCVVARMTIQEQSNVLVHTLVQDMDKLSRKALHRAVTRYAKRFFEQPKLTVLRYGVG